MTFVYGFRLLIVITLLVSVSLKLIPMDRPNNLSYDLVDFLLQNNFEIESADQIIDNDVVAAVDAPVIKAVKGICHITVARLNYDGSNADRVKNILGNADRKFVVFEGKIYQNQPIILTVLDHFLSVVFTRLRIGSRRPPAIVVGADPSCAAELLPWNDINWNGAKRG